MKTIPPLPEYGNIEYRQYTQAAPEKQVEENYRVQNLSLQSASEETPGWSLFKETCSQITE